MSGCEKVTCYEDEYAEKEIKELEDNLKCRKLKESYIRELLGKQNGRLSVKSAYYKGKIAGGNWSLIKDSNIEKLNAEFDGSFEIDGIPKKEKDAEYEYIFVPSYYIFKILMQYYIANKDVAERIYNLKTSIAGGLIFILKYIGGDYKDNRIDFCDFIEELLDFASDSEYKDSFVNEIIDCLNNFYNKDLILERRIRNYNESKENWFTVDFYKDKDFLLHYTPVKDYRILGHKDIEKDLKHLQKRQAEKAKEKIRKTPNHPNNDVPEDSEALRGDLKGWFSQRISKKDRLVYKKDFENKIVYIATACSHYDTATRRIKLTDSYREIKDY